MTRAGIAALWAAAYGTLALGWTVTGHGFPFGTADDRSDASTLRALTPEAGAPLFAAVLLLTAVLALLMRGPRRTWVAAGAWTVTALLLVVVPDARLLTLAGYLPMLIVGLPFGWPPVDLADVFTWALANQVCCVAGGVLLARATLRYQFGDAGLPRLRWGRQLTWVAAAIPALYAVVRLAWAAGVPLGISREFLTEMQDTGVVWAGAGLGAFALAGAVLTLGLVQRWGEVFPRWMIGLAGRRVPVRLATVPAALVAILVTQASISLLTADGFLTLFTGGISLATLPMLLWPFWGVALGGAALAYHQRRVPLVPAVRAGAY